MRILTDPREAASQLASGALLVHPTAGLWGIAADPLCAAGMERLSALKGGERSGFVIVAADPEMLRGWFGGPPRVAALLGRPRAGPLTLVLPAGPRAPRAAVSGVGTVALRVSSHEGAARLCRALGHGFVSTSLNLAGRPPAASLEELDPRLAASLDGIYRAGPEPLGRASTIIDLCGGEPRLLRAGDLTLDDFRAALRP